MIYLSLKIICWTKFSLHVFLLHLQNLCKKTKIILGMEMIYFVFISVFSMFALFAQHEAANHVFSLQIYIHQFIIIINSIFKVGIYNSIEILIQTN